MSQADFECWNTFTCKIFELSNLHVQNNIYIYEKTYEHTNNTIRSKEQRPSNLLWVDAETDKTKSRHVK